MSKLRTAPKIFVPVLVFAFVLALLPAASSMAAPASPKAPVTTSTDAALAKIHPKLRVDLGLENGAVTAMAASDEIDLVVYIKAGVDISRYFDSSLTRPFVNALGYQLVVGTTTANNVVKIASDANVVAVKPFEATTTAPPSPEDDPGVSKAAMLARQQALRATGVSGWWDVGAGHNARGAWEQGYTGDGVIAFANDSGVDFAHPDLMGRWAVITDQASPYYGWPIMYDAFSMYLYARDNALGESNIANGLGDYADTSTVCSDPCQYQPLGASAARTFVLPGTSVSGEYHIGSHPDQGLADAVHGDWDGRPEGEERVAILVVDANHAGVYDTVYVDMNGNYDFSDDEPVNRDNPVASLDYWDSMAGAPGQDGYADLSGGLVYFIADGMNPIPATNWWWGALAPPPENGSLVAFAIADVADSGDHGTLTASNIVGQGVIDGDAPPWKPAGDGTPFTGLVQAAGRDAKLTMNGDSYACEFCLNEDPFYFAALGYDGIPGTGDDAQVINNSWGYSGTHNDGWDFDSRNIDAVIRTLNPTLTSVHSTGNGAAGYGTISPSSPPSGIGVGASTQFGSTGTFDSITDVDQINWGDVISFSNRGAGARGVNGVHVTADGAFAAGDLPLNMIGDGWTAWDSWGGTSRSGPVAAGTLTLIYDAYKKANGVWPTYDVARSILMAGADNQHYDGFVQGAGSVNGGMSAAIAGGNGGFYVMPDNWTGGDYRGTEYPGFANIMHAGDSSTRTFTLYNPGASEAEVAISTDQLVKIAEYSFSFTSKNQALEDGAFTKPDYLFEITDLIPEGTDLMEVKVAFPFTQYDADGNYNADQRWRVHVQDWKDVNDDGDLWVDLNGDGVVNWNEIDEGEYIRFSYGYDDGPSLQTRVKQPLERMHDGIFLSLRHRNRTAAIPTTDLKFQINFYSHADVDWLSVDSGMLTVPAGGTASFDATIALPEDVDVGLYEGFILVDAADASMQAVVPVVANVAAASTDFTFGGGRASDTPYDNGYMFGYTNWSWRAESGDWRFFFTDIMDEMPEGAMMLVDTQWESPYTDIDTLVMGPTMDKFSDPEEGDPAVYGPYTLATLPGSSVDTYIGGGKYLRQTSTSGPREIVAVPVSEGLHLIALHNVLYGGEYTDESFSGQVGTLNVVPTGLDIEAKSNTVQAQIKVTSSLALDDIVAEGFGLGLPEIYTDQVVNQDDPNDPSTASYTRTVTIEHGATLDVVLDGKDTDDLDLFVYDPEGNLAGASTTSTADEHVNIQFPEDGDWTIAVHGWSVPGGTTTFDLFVNAMQGYDIVVTNLPDGPFPPGEEITIDLKIGRDMMNGDVLEGIVLLGPSVAPGLVEVPVRVEAVQPDPITVQMMAIADTWINGGDTATNYDDYAAIIVRTSGLDNGLITFDRSALPEGAEIVEAKLMVNATLETGAFGKELTVLNVEPFDSATVTYDTAPATFNPGESVPVALGEMTFDVKSNIVAWDAMGPQTVEDQHLGQLALSGTGPWGRVAMSAIESWPPSGQAKLIVRYIPERQ